LAVMVSLTLSLLARNVSRKCPLFASPSLTVCKPLHLTIYDYHCLWSSVDFSHHAPLRAFLFNFPLVSAGKSESRSAVSSCNHAMDEDVRGAFERVVYLQLADKSDIPHRGFDFGEFSSVKPGIPISQELE
jgi:hypothetical protein